MRDSIGSIALYNIIIIFMVIVFGFAGGIITYQKAYKVNSKIAAALEKSESYNDIAINEINRVLGNLGYRAYNGKKCKDMEDATLITDENRLPSYDYCIYQTKDGKYDQYTIVTYIYIDLPFVDEFRFSVKSKTSAIYQFGGQK